MSRMVKEYSKQLFNRYDREKAEKDLDGLDMVYSFLRDPQSGDSDEWGYIRGAILDEVEMAVCDSFWPLCPDTRSLAIDVSPSEVRVTWRPLGFFSACNSMVFWKTNQFLEQLGLALDCLPETLEERL